MWRFNSQECKRKYSGPNWSPNIFRDTLKKGLIRVVTVLADFRPVMFQIAAASSAHSTKLHLRSVAANASLNYLGVYH